MPSFPWSRYFYSSKDVMFRFPRCKTLALIFTTTVRCQPFLKEELRKKLGLRCTGNFEIREQLPHTW